jgi:hypothetical protein
LTRGRKLYNDGEVKRIQKFINNSYEAKIGYRNPYTVNIEILGDDISTSCNCLYASKCEHAAAAMYKIDELYGIDGFTEKISPFTEPEDYQYFNLCKIVNHEGFSKEKNDKALKMVQQGEVVLT